jgi:hypothetical protein
MGLVLYEHGRRKLIVSLCNPAPLQYVPVGVVLVIAAARGPRFRAGCFAQHLSGDYPTLINR